MEKEQDLVLENPVFKAFEGIRDSWLDEINQNINSRCGQELRNKLLAINEIDDIYLNTYDDASQVNKYTDICKTYCNTFAINFNPSFDAQLKYAHIILVNKKLCEESKLSPDELSAIVLHELGHIMNHVDNVPTELGGDPAKVIKMRCNQLKDNIVINEYAADYFAASLGFGDYIVSTLQKSSTMDSLKNMHFEFELRINKIQNNECCNGAYKRLYGSNLGGKS